MKLKYVGAMPKVSQHGVTFDQTQPDRYSYLSAALELLETLDFDYDDGKEIHLFHPNTNDYSAAELEAKIEKYCDDLNGMIDAQEEKTREFVRNYREHVASNPNLSADERTAWLGNIDIMFDYYLQYMINKSVYECLLNVMAEKIYTLKIDYVTFPLGRNYGLVLSHLIDILRDYKHPFDATLSVIEQDGTTIGKLDMNRPVPLSC